MNKDFIIECINSISETIINNENEIESLDRAIGDGDHYINLKRGSVAIQSLIPDFINLSNSEIFKMIGMKLLSTVGGASGPLFASFFIEFSKKIGNSENELKNIYLGFESGVEAIKKRGKAQINEKTMLDVLIPVAKVFKEEIEKQSDLETILLSIKKEAIDGVEKTKDLLPLKGRAATLGERAIGHVDPGAKSCQLIISTICKKIFEKVK